MKTKFKKSSIKISGSILIETDDIDFSENDIEIDLKGLKQSKSGVYCLRNKLNGRLYIGMARNLENRKQRHWNNLISGKHANKVLLTDFQNNLYQENNDIYSPTDLFEFEVIIYCRPSELTFYEHLLITHLQPYYNIHKQKEVIREEPEIIDLTDKNVVKDIVKRHWESMGE